MWVSDPQGGTPFKADIRGLKIIARHSKATNRLNQNEALAPKFQRITNKMFNEFNSKSQISLDVPRLPMVNLFVLDEESISLQARYEVAHWCKLNTLR